MLGTAKSDVDEKGFIVHGLLSSLNSSVVWHSVKFIPTKETPERVFLYSENQIIFVLSTYFEPKEYN